MKRFFLLIFIFTNITFAQNSLSATNWEGNWWSSNVNMGSWFPQQQSLSDFSKNDFSWGQIRTIGQISPGSSINIEAQVMLNSDGTNGDGAYFCVGDGWVTYAGNNYGIAFRNGKVFFFDSGNLQDSIGTYKIGEMINFTLTFNNNRSITAQGNGFLGTLTPANVVSNAKWIIANSNSEAYQGFYIKAPVIVGIDDISQTLITYSLSQNYPNPFNPSTKISYQLPSAGNVRLKIYDAIGNEVANLVDEFKQTGEYEVEFDASQLSSGIYFYQLKTSDFIATKKMILLK
jgi:hypothetical protein